MVMQLLIDVLFGENESRKEVYYIHECSSKSSKRSWEDADQITIFCVAFFFFLFDMRIIIVFIQRR